MEAAKDIIFGSVAGTLGKFVEYPFDTVKVRLQSQSSPSPISGRSQGPLDAFAAAWRSPEGPLRNLYRGISAPVVGAAVETSALFFSYRIIQDLLVTYVPSLHGVELDSSNGRPNLPFSALLVAGAASGTFTSFLLTPIELIKCRMQVPSSSGFGTSHQTKPNPMQLIKQVLKSQGILGFWHGHLGTLIRETGGSAAWFGSYEGVKILLQRRNAAASRSSPLETSHTDQSLPSSGAAPASVPQQLLAGAAAGISYNFFFYPADTIKSRMQTEDAAAAGLRQTRFMTSAQELWRQQGLKGFYRGCGITVFRSAPSSAIIFSIYEALRRAFN